VPEIRVEGTKTGETGRVSGLKLPVGAQNGGSRRKTEETGRVSGKTLPVGGHNGGFAERRSTSHNRREQAKDRMPSITEGAGCRCEKLSAATKKNRGVSSSGSR